MLFYDIHILLDFLYSIIHDDLGPKTDNCIFILATKDLSFVRDAEKEFKNRTKGKNGVVHLDFSENSVSASIKTKEGTKQIKIQVFKLGSVSSDEAIRELINKVNQLISRAC